MVNTAVGHGCLAVLGKQSARKPRKPRKRRKNKEKEKRQKPVTCCALFFFSPEFEILEFGLAFKRI